MAQQFLDQLAKIPENELSKDSFCMICHRDYGTEPAEIAVRLPCDHHVGFECISIWLSPERDSKNSCPMCRHVFFDVVDEEAEEEYRREILRWVGQPPQEGEARGNSSRWYRYFGEAAAEQYQDSLTRARAFLARHPPGRSYSAEENEYYITNLATAFRTLAVREMLLYMEFGRDGAFPLIRGPVRGPLDAEQTEAFFQELRRRGAFEPDLHPCQHYQGLTDRQMWLLHREEGESYSTAEGGFWSLSLV